jgi:hypothetical protein
MEFELVLAHAAIFEIMYALISKTECLVLKSLRMSLVGVQRVEMRCGGKVVSSTFPLN